MKNNYQNSSFKIVLILFLVLWQGGLSSLITQEITFNHVSIEDGLSQSTINCAFQDHRGFMWFGTQDGLNSFDGYNFVIYRHDPTDSTSISNNWIQSIFEDRTGSLWVGTGSGLNLYDPRTKTFSAFKNDPKDSSSLLITS